MLGVGWLGIEGACPESLHQKTKFNQKQPNRHKTILKTYLSNFSASSAAIGWAGISGRPFTSLISGRYTHSEMNYFILKIFISFIRELLQIITIAWSIIFVKQLFINSNRSVKSNGKSLNRIFPKHSTWAETHSVVIPIHHSNY